MAGWKAAGVVLCLGSLLLLRTAAESDARLFIADTASVNFINVSTGFRHQIPVGSVSRSIRVVFDSTTQRIFWTDIATRTINSAGVDGSDVRIVRQLPGGANPEGIAVDHLLQLLFYSDSDLSLIGVMGTDGAGYRVLLQNNVEYPRALAVDVVHEMLFYSDWGARPRISRVRYDGSQHEDIVTTDIEWPNGLTLDTQSGRLYWCDRRTLKIESVLVTGQQRRVVITSTPTHGFLDIAFVDSTLYYTFFGGTQVQTLSTDGRNVSTIGPDTFTSPMWGISAYSSAQDISLAEKQAALPPPDPCTSHTVVRDAEKRSTSYRAAPGEDLLCDVSLQEGWYRFLGGAGEDMATNNSCPQGACGSNSTICLNDAGLPSVADGEVNGTVCRNGLTSCESEWQIRMKNCGHYRVYYLPPSDECDSAYCIGTEVKCPEGECSETGYTPNCDRCPSNVTLSPNVSVAVELRRFQKNQIGTIVFSCEFAPAAPSFPELLYDVFWYMEGVLVASFPGLTAGQLQQSRLQEEHWNDAGLGVTVNCSVRARYANSTSAGPLFHSEPFFAGLEVDRSTVEVEEGGSAVVRVRSTVPLPHVVYSSGRSQGTLYVYVFTPASDSSGLACGNAAGGSIAFKQEVNCGVELHFSNYSEWVPLEVTGVVDNLYTGDRQTYLKLGVHKSIFALPNRRLWNNYTLPDVRVLIKEKDAQLSGAVCQSFDDPHMTTGDGPRWGWENHRIGEFILYRHNRLPLAVHVKYRYCGHVWNGYRVTCNCGVAIRAYSSLIVVDRCSSYGDTSRPLNYVSYLGCSDRHLVISRSGYTYKVTMPTGTVVQFNVYPYYSPGIGSVNLFPSLADFNLTAGLCGLVDGDVTNDFTLRNGQVTSSWDDFAEDWRANRSESLFVETPDLSVPGPAGRTYCLCESTDDALVAESTCHLKYPTKRCPQADSRKVKAFLSFCRESRGRRDLHLSDRVSDGPSGWQPADVHDIQRRSASGDQNATVPDWTGNWTEVSARAHCERAFNQSAGGSLLEEATGFTAAKQRHLDACVLDIKLTGGTAYTETTVEIFKGIALEAVGRNVTFLSSEEGRQVMADIRNNSCPLDCSGHGTCLDGACLCQAGFVGQDCNISQATPPQNPYIPQEGLCNTKSRACLSTPVLADNLPEEGTVYCRFKKFQVKASGATYGSQAETRVAEPWMPGQVQCPFPSHRVKRQAAPAVSPQGYKVSLSNDNQTFSLEVVVIVFDGDCHTCHAANVTCQPTGRCTENSPSGSPGSTESTSRTVVVVASVLGVLAVALAVGVTLFLVHRFHLKARVPVNPMMMVESRPSVPPQSFQTPNSKWL